MTLPDGLARALSLHKLNVSSLSLILRASPTLLKKYLSPPQTSTIPLTSISRQTSERLLGIRLKYTRVPRSMYDSTISSRT